MSGFIGYYELFLKLELALDIKLEQSEKNVFNLEDKYLNEAINSIEVREAEDRKNIQDFLYSYLKANI